MSRTYGEYSYDEKLSINESLVSNQKRQIQQLSDRNQELIDIIKISVTLLCRAGRNQPFKKNMKRFFKEYGINSDNYF